MKCPALMNGYHNRPDVKPPFTEDGFYVTGDVFRRDGMWLTAGGWGGPRDTEPVVLTGAGLLTVMLGRRG